MIHLPVNCQICKVPIQWGDVSDFHLALHYAARFGTVQRKCRPKGDQTTVPTNCQPFRGSMRLIARHPSFCQAIGIPDWGTFHNFPHSPPPHHSRCEHLGFSSYFNPAPKMNPAPMQSGRVLLSPPYMITREVMLSVRYFGWFWPPRKSHANIIFRLLIKPEKLWTGINEMYFWLTPRTENICERKNNFTECERVWLRPKFRFKDMQIVVLDPPGTI